MGFLALWQNLGCILELQWGWQFETPLRSIKQIKVPYLLDWEQGIALHALQGKRASSLCERQVAWFFSSCGGNLGYILELWQG